MVSAVALNVIVVTLPVKIKSLYQVISRLLKNTLLESEEESHGEENNLHLFGAEMYYL